jgi:hypothetical protein
VFMILHGTRILSVVLRVVQRSSACEQSEQGGGERARLRQIG